MGYYGDGSGVTHGYVYNMSTATYTTIDPPGSANTYVLATSGNDILGEYVAGGVAYGFLYNISTSAYTSFAPPGSVSTLADGVSGNEWWGYYGDGSGVTHGYLYDMSTATYTSFDPPGSTNTFVYSMSGSNIAGNYADAGNVQHGFLYQLAPVQSDFTPTVNWGGTVTGTPAVSVQLVSQTATGSTWEVVGNATYANAGIATPTVTVTDATGSSVQTSHVSFDVFAPSQTVLTDTTPVVTVKAVVGTSTGNVALARFTDAIPAAGLLSELAVPGAATTSVKAVFGNDIFGYYVAGGVAYGFLYTFRPRHTRRSRCPGRAAQSPLE